MINSKAPRKFKSLAPRLLYNKQDKNTNSLKVSTFSEASENSTSPLGRGLVGNGLTGSDEEFSTLTVGSCTSYIMLVGSSENIVTSLTVPREALESVDRDMYLVNTMLYLRVRIPYLRLTTSTLYNLNWITFNMILIKERPNGNYSPLFPKETENYSYLHSSYSQSWVSADVQRNIVYTFMGCLLPTLLHSGRRLGAPHCHMFGVATYCSRRIIVLPDAS